MSKTKTEYVKDYILLNILNNIYQKNKKIPSEKELCNKLRVSRQTVKNAIAILKASGWLYSLQGKGNFVYDDNSFFAHNLAQHLQAQSTTIELLNENDFLKTLIKIDDIENPLFYVKKYFDKQKELLAYSLCAMSKFNAWNIDLKQIKDGLIKSLKNNNVAIERMDQQITTAHNYPQLQKIGSQLGYSSLDFPIVKTLTVKKSGEIIEKSLVILHKEKMEVKKQIFF